jgi:catechol 2,3-dioxygenase-like lactoylglutathione lyase family enzyme
MADAPVVRVARPTDNLAAIADMYREGLGLAELGRFEGHNGFDGVILGHPDKPWHLEFTSQRGHSVGRAPSEDNLLVFYLPERDEWTARCSQMLAAGFVAVPAYNSYWDKQGKTFEDLDGYRVVLQNAAWTR